MDSLNKEDLKEEISSVNEVIKAHEDQLKLNSKAIKNLSFIKFLLERELEKETKA